MASSLSKMKKLTLLPRIIIAILLGVLLGQWMPEAGVRVFVTYNYLFSQFLGFLIPLIIIGLIVPAISEIGQSAGRLLLTVGLAYADTIIAGLPGYATGTTLFPSLVAQNASLAVEKADKLIPFFTLDIPPYWT